MTCNKRRKDLGTASLPIRGYFKDFVDAFLAVDLTLGEDVMAAIEGRMDDPGADEDLLAGLVYDACGVV